jgi:hypothetical protein
MLFGKINSDYYADALDFSYSLVFTFHIGFTCKKKKNIANFHVLGLSIPKKSDAPVGRV